MRRQARPRCNPNSRGRPRQRSSSDSIVQATAHSRPSQRECRKAQMAVAAPPRVLPRVLRQRPTAMPETASTLLPPRRRFGLDSCKSWHRLRSSPPPRYRALLPPPSPSPVAVSVPPPEGEEPPKKRVAAADAAAAAAAAAATPSEKPPVESKSLQPLRQMVRRAVEHGSVEAAVLLCIFLSSVSLALDDPRSDRASPFNQALFTLDLVFTSLFTVEALGKIYAYGFIGPRDAYLSSPWNALDLGVVVIGWVSVALAITQVSSGGVNTLRALRTLRPLRLVRRVRP